MQYCDMIIISECLFWLEPNEKWEKLDQVKQTRNYGRNAKMTAAWAIAKAMEGLSEILFMLTLLYVLINQYKYKYI